MHAMLKPVRAALCLSLCLAPVWCATLELLSLNDLISKSSANDVCKRQVARLFGLLQRVRDLHAL